MRFTLKRSALLEDLQKEFSNMKDILISKDSISFIVSDSTISTMSATDLEKKIEDICKRHGFVIDKIED